ncbi:MAG: ergothioneine biosynthesis protein EgtB [Nitrospirae bacterium]|nr:MAG: ergothioneine biosynthesis protein EgtB [Nitrospirota bacterium]
MLMPASVELRTALTAARACTDAIFSLIKPNALYERPIPERHRLIFYLGHLEAFDWNQICRWTLGLASFHPEFDQLFEAGIDPPVGEASSDRPQDWPAVKDVYQYNGQVRREIDRVLDQAPPEVLHMAIEHRWMHAETTAYLLHRLPNTMKIAPALRPLPAAPPPIHHMIEIPEGPATLGRTREEGFGWDNEFERHVVQVPAFAISKYKVTNEQYLKFVEDGANPPPFWRRRGRQWFLLTTFGEIPLPPHCPVYVSQREAQAYANWAGLALPTEAQLHRAAYATRHGDERAYPWGNDPPDESRGNFHFAYWDPIPVTATPAGDSDFGVAQLVGNGWEWTATPFHPFEGFEPYPTYPGYSARFFDQDHFVMKGASPTTPRDLLRRSFRNWFRQDYPYVHAGFRCVHPG